MWYRANYTPINWGWWDGTLKRVGVETLKFLICTEAKIPWLHFCLFNLFIFSSVQFSCSVMSGSLQSHILQLAKLPSSLSTPGAYSNSCPLSWWCHPTISSSVVPISSHLQFFPASGSFSMSKFLASDDQSTGVSASASVLPMNIQDWFPLRLTGLISLQSKRLSRVFPALQFKSINSSALSFLYGPTFTSLHDYWKNHSFDLTDLCWQSNVSAFEYAV